MAISAYDDNQFAYRKPTRAQTKLTSERKLRRHLPLWLDALIILILVGGAGAAGWILSHPSAHRSPDTIATDFAVQVGSANYVAAAADVDPADRAAALATLKSDAGVPGGALDGTHSTKLGSSTTSGTTANVVVQSCNTSLACNNLPVIPCIKIDGAWYVAWTPLLQSLATS
jgi:cytoskeletal protein RodZ